MADISDLFDGVSLPWESIPLVCDLDSRKVMTAYELNCKGGKWKCTDYPRLSKESSLKLLLTSENLIYSYKRPHRNRLGSKHKLFMSESEKKSQEKSVAKAVEEFGLPKWIKKELERVERWHDLLHPTRKYLPTDPLFASTNAQLGNESIVYSKIQNELDEINTHAWQGTANDMGAVKALQGVNPILKTPLEEALDTMTEYDALYGESARNVLEAFDNGLSNQDIFKSIHDYTTNVDAMLSGGINADVAQALIDPHVAVMERFQYWEVPEPELELEPEKETDEDWKKEAKKLRLEKEADNEEIVRLNADNSMMQAKYAKLESQYEFIKSFLGESVFESLNSTAEENKYLKKRNEELEPLAELPEPTADEDKFFQSLSRRLQEQVNLISKVVKGLRFTSIGNGEKRKIHTECNSRNPQLITASFSTFSTHAWSNARKSGRTPK